MDQVVSDTAGGAEVVVWVVPGASRTEIVGVHGDALRIRVAQPPERGRANDAAVRLLGDAIGAPVRLVAGTSGRRKRVFAAGVTAAEVRAALGI